MARLAPAPVHLSDSERADLHSLLNRHSTGQQIALRGRMILLADAGKNHREIARELNISRAFSRCPPPGRPPTFTLEQTLQLFALACSNPEASRRPISHWTPRELADELVQRGIVESISPRHVGRLLAEADLKPHQMQYWLNPPPTQNLTRRSKIFVTCT